MALGGSDKSRTLGELFTSLPCELRAEVFHFVLETGSKWDQVHLKGCRRVSSDIAQLDFDEKVGQCLACPEDFCPRCDDPSKTTWRDMVRLDGEAREQLRLRQGPWEVARIREPSGRSRWMSEGTNPYLCLTCLQEVRGKPQPVIRLFPCLCARRKDLAVLLVCQRWYEEAARLLRSHSTFAFDDTTILCNFLQGTSSQLRGCLTRVSLLAYDFFDWAKDLPKPEDLVTRTDGISSTWALLGSLPNLVDLELDGVFLLLRSVVDELVKLELPSRPRVSFVLRAPRSFATAHSPSAVWPQLALRTILQGSLPGLVADIMTKRYEGSEGRFRVLPMSIDAAYNDYAGKVEKLYHVNQAGKWRMVGKRILDLDARRMSRM